MKNSEKYRTADERALAFDNFCNGRTPCDKCKLNNSVAAKRLGCAYAWLDLEAEAEMPMDCPFCGETCFINTHSEGHEVRCSNRHCYVGKTFESKKEAIAAHNRICRAVKGGEGKRGEVMITDKEFLKGETECPVYGKAVEENPHWCKECNIGTDGTAICPFRKYGSEVK